MSDALKLWAEDKGDLSVIASAIQDGIVRIGDVQFDPKARSLTLQMSRFRHEVKRPSRIQSGLRIDGVTALRSSGINRDNPNAFAVLLNIAFEEADAPSGVVTLTFAGGGAIEAEVEALDVLLADAGQARPAKRPDHRDADSLTA